MKRALVIIAAVAGYALMETALLLSVIPAQSWGSFLGRYQATVSCAQFLLIPGMAVVFSRAIYGSYQWKRRTLAILLAGALGVPVSVTLLLLAVALLALAADLSVILFYFLLPVVLGTLACAMYWCVKHSGKWGIQADAAQWLADRRCEITKREPSSRSRGIRFALWIPTLIALLLFLFLPETWGILSHLGPQNSRDLSGYRVSIPVTWVILFRWNEESEGRSSVNGIAGRGIGLGNNPLRFDALSSWQVWTKSFSQSETTDYDRWPPNENDILSRRAIAVGNESLACLDYWPSNGWSPPRSEAATIAHVTCGGASRLRARFDGTRNQLPTFYRMLSEIIQAR